MSVSSWKEFISIESKKDYYKKIISFVLEDSKTNTVYPKHKDLFSAFNLCPLDKTKVVIIGQDPYFHENQAHGLSFSVQPGVDIPPSLNNIFKELNTSFNVDHKFKDGCLIPWAEQGVLLLNSILTVRKLKPSSHEKAGWQQFTDNALSLLDSLNKPVVYMLWGYFAKTKKPLIKNPNSLILEAAHPSPLSAYKGFLGCNHFVKTNEYLTSNGLEPIYWFF